MPDRRAEGDASDGPTRRQTLGGLGGLVIGGSLAGCAGRSDSTTPASDSGAADTTETTAAGATETEPDPVHTVEMVPVGEVVFESVPERWVAYTGDYADMGVALGRADGLAAVGVLARFGTHCYEALPGVSVDTDALVELWQDGTGKEQFYDLAADVHVIDPNFVRHRLQWSEGDVAEIRDNVAPFVGNTGFSHVYDWHDYRYYTLYEAFEKLATLFDERPRFEAFADYHDEVLATVRSRLPAESPSVAVVYPDAVPPTSFYPYRIGAGTQSKHWRDLQVTDAFEGHGITDAQAGGETIDYETLLSVDPDVLAVRLQGEITPSYFETEIVSHLRSHRVASELSAVQDDRVVYGGLTYQGPIIHLFQLEQAAQSLYPERFGTVTGDETLFDRDRVAGIVTGEGLS